MKNNTFNLLNREFGINEKVLNLVNEAEQEVS